MVPLRLTKYRPLFQRGLFLLAMIAPGILLVALSFRLLSQDSELAATRASERRRLATVEIAQKLTTGLEHLKRQAVAGGPAWTFDRDHAIALVAGVEGQKLALPWDLDPERTRFIAEVAASPFAEAIASAQRDEYVTRDAAAAHAGYRAAVTVARSPEQRAAATLALLRTSSSQADIDHAVVSLLRSPVVDEEGIPVSLYAAGAALAGRGRVSPADIVRTLRSALDRVPSLNVLALDMIRGLADDPHLPASQLTAVSALRADAQARLGAAQQAQDLRDSFAGIAARAEGLDPPWIPFGPDEEMWLVALTRPPASAGTMAVVVRARVALADVPVVRRLDEGVEALGARFPGLFVRVPLAAEGRGSIRTGLIAVVVLTLTIALSGSWFFWRDVQRDLRLAELRSQFVASVSHELKTPLTAIRMFAETLRLGRTPPERTSEYLDTIVSESERLTRLMNNVLDFSRVEQGTRTYRLTSQPLAPIVRSAARTLRYPLEQAAFDLQLVIDDRHLEARCDADALEQAILNLMNNAMKYSGASRSIEMRLVGNAAGAAITVRDNGIGIPASEQSRIFEKFYRGAADDHQRVPGTGLGLTLVQHTVAAHGGTVTVESSPGHGSAFTILLPAVNGDPLAPTAAEVAHDASPSVIES